MQAFKIILADLNSQLVRAWSDEFRPYPDVLVFGGSIFDVEADAIVSPANSFGIMDGGLDGKLRDYFGVALENAVRQRIESEFHRELPVGLATVVATNNVRFPFLVCAPTMRYPADVSLTINAYLAMKAALSACQNHPTVARLAVPGLCSLSGQMPPLQVARQIRIAYERVALGMYRYTHWREERAFEPFIRGTAPYPPEDLER